MPMRMRVVDTLRANGAGVPLSKVHLFSGLPLPVHRTGFAGAAGLTAVCRGYVAPVRDWGSGSHCRADKMAPRE